MSDDQMAGDGSPLLYGAATVGERGQIVIPAEAREACGLRAGEKVLVLGAPDRIGLVVARLQDVQRVLARFQRLAEAAEGLEPDEAEGSLASG